MIYSQGSLHTRTNWHFIFLQKMCVPDLQEGTNNQESVTYDVSQTL